MGRPAARSRAATSRITSSTWSPARSMAAYGAVSRVSPCPLRSNATASVGSPPNAADPRSRRSSGSHVDLFMPFPWASTSTVRRRVEAPPPLGGGTSATPATATPDAVNHVGPSRSIASILVASASRARVTCGGHVRGSARGAERRASRVSPTRIHGDLHGDGAALRARATRPLRPLTCSPPCGWCAPPSNRARTPATKRTRPSR